MKTIIITFFTISIVQFQSCTLKTKDNISKNDTISVLKLILNSKKLTEELTPLYKIQPLRIVRNQFLLADYYFKINDREVLYTNIDSTNYKLMDWKRPQYYLKIEKFQFKVGNEFKGIFRFQSIGAVATIKMRKKNERWEIRKMTIVQY